MVPKPPLIKCLLVISITGIISSPAISQIQETRDQLKARYGSALSVGGQDVFKKDPFHITVFYDDNGRSKLIIYALEKGAETDPQLNEKSLNKILNHLSNGLSWNIIENKASETTYVRSDKKVFARMNPKQGLIYFLTPDAMRAYEKAQ
jgi:hypothetical protein